MARPNKQQHKIPRTYLQGFTDNNGKVWVADKNLSIRSQKPVEVLTEKDYYTVKIPSGKETLIIETQYLNGIENTFAEIYARVIIPRATLTPKEKAEMAIFIASMMERVPNRRATLTKFFEDVNRVTTQMKSLPLEARKAMASISDHNKDNSISADDLIEMGKDVKSLHSTLIPKTVQSIAPIIFDMHWCILLKPVTSESFITSDDPCKLINPELESIYGKGKLGAAAGLAQNDVELTLPLSSNECLITGWLLEKDLFYLTATPEEVKDINRRTRRHSQNLISNSKDILETEVERIKKYRIDIQKRGS